jgi:hypothetical protein
MKSSLRVIVLVVLAFVIGASVPVMAATQKTTSKKPAKKVTKKAPAPKKKVLGKTTKKVVYSVLPGGLINCNMPDGKVIKAPKKDCDAVNEFWSKNKPKGGSSSSNNSGSSSSSSNSSGSNNNSNNTPAPVVNPTVTNVQTALCTSSSCNFATTIEITGTNFTNGAVVSLINGAQEINKNTTVNFTPDAQLAFENGSNRIIYDFYHLDCVIYDLKVTFPNGKTVTKAAAVNPCSI